MKKTELVSAGNELNALLFAEDNPQIDIKGGAPEMKANIYESLKLLEPTDTLTKETIATILECDFAFDDGYFAEGVEKKDVLLTSLEKLGIWVNEPTQDDAPADDDLATEVQNAPTLQELKKIAKANDEFKSIRGSLTKYDDVDELITDMLALLEDEPEDAKVVEEEEAPKKKVPAKKKPATKEEKEDEPAPAKKAAEVKKPATKKGDKKPGVIATIVEAIEGSGKKGISKEELLEVLEEAFPDRVSESMKKTINVQVPGRISREKFEIEKLENGNFKKK